jgi:hypothetical protein
MTQRGTIKTSTILISAGRRLRIFHDLAEVPPALRRKLMRSTSGSNAGTVLIADRRGAQELLRANIRALLERPADKPRPLARQLTLLTLNFLLLHRWKVLGGGLAIALAWYLLVLFR